MFAEGQSPTHMTIDSVWHNTRYMWILQWIPIGYNLVNPSYNLGDASYNLGEPGYNLATAVRRPEHSGLFLQILSFFVLNFAMVFWDRFLAPDYVLG